MHLEYFNPALFNTKSAWKVFVPLYLKKNGKQYEEHCGHLHEHSNICLVEYCLFNPVFIQTRVITLVQKIYTNIQGL
jgi:hypothetical protein